ncbi:MAG: malate dehydrogenase [Cenarchaeum symbiont of Oopsacas minuta]|nr:malate dehydrogenase [Cenarchaeum symbiont of Oopsacas minuta]
MITIVGAGKVGGDAAMFCALRNLGDILLLDIVDGLPRGEAMDINQMLSERGIDSHVRGSTDYSEMKDSDIVVVVAGSPRKPGMTRMDLLKINSSIVSNVAKKIKQYAPNSIIIPVTNPLDPMVYATYKASGFDRKKIIGMGGMLDLSRFRQYIHEATGKSRDSIRAMVISEHGEQMLPLVRYASISGVPLRYLLSDEKLAEIVDETKKSAAKIIELKGATVHAPGNSISAIADSILNDKKQLIPVSACIDGQYGHSNVAIGVPAVIGRKGIIDIIELELNDAEKVVFDAGVDNVKNAIKSMEL